MKQNACQLLLVQHHSGEENFSEYDWLILWFFPRKKEMDFHEIFFVEKHVKNFIVPESFMKTENIFHQLKMISQYLN